MNVATICWEHDSFALLYPIWNFRFAFLPHKSSKLLDSFCKSRSFTMQTHSFFWNCHCSSSQALKLMLGMWKPTPNRYILLQQITNSHGNKSYNKQTEEKLRLITQPFLPIRCSSQNRHWGFPWQHVSQHHGSAPWTGLLESHIHHLTVAGPYLL